MKSDKIKINITNLRVEAGLEWDMLSPIMPGRVTPFNPSLLSYTPVGPSFPHNQAKLGQLCGDCLALRIEYGRQVGLIAVSTFLSTINKVID